MNYYVNLVLAFSIFDNKDTFLFNDYKRYVFPIFELFNKRCIRGDRQQLMRGAHNFCFLLRSCTAWMTDSIWEDNRSAQMNNTVCWPKQSVSVPFALYIKKNC